MSNDYVRTVFPEFDGGSKSDGPGGEDLSLSALSKILTSQPYDITDIWTHILNFQPEQHFQFPNPVDTLKAVADVVSKMKFANAPKVIGVDKINKETVNDAAVSIIQFLAFTLRENKRFETADALNRLVGMLEERLGKLSPSDNLMSGTTPEEKIQSLLVNTIVMSRTTLPLLMSKAAILKTIMELDCKLVESSLALISDQVGSSGQLSGLRAGIEKISKIHKHLHDIGHNLLKEDMAILASNWKVKEMAQLITLEEAHIHPGLDQVNKNLLMAIMSLASAEDTINKLARTNDKLRDAVKKINLKKDSDVLLALEYLTDNLNKLAAHMSPEDMARLRTLLNSMAVLRGEMRFVGGKLTESKGDGIIYISDDNAKQMKTLMSNTSNMQIEIIERNLNAPMDEITKTVSELMNAIQHRQGGWKHDNLPPIIMQIGVLLRTFPRQSLCRKIAKAIALRSLPLDLISSTKNFQEQLSQLSRHINNLHSIFKSEDDVSTVIPIVARLQNNVTVLQQVIRELTTTMDEITPIKGILSGPLYKIMQGGKRLKVLEHDPDTFQPMVGAVPREIDENEFDPLNAFEEGFEDDDELDYSSNDNLDGGAKSKKKKTATKGVRKLTMVPEKVVKHNWSLPNLYGIGAALPHSGGWPWGGGSDDLRGLLPEDQQIPPDFQNPTANSNTNSSNKQDKYTILTQGSNVMFVVEGGGAKPRPPPAVTMADYEMDQYACENENNSYYEGGARKAVTKRKSNVKKSKRIISRAGMFMVGGEPSILPISKTVKESGKQLEIFAKTMAIRQNLVDFSDMIREKAPVNAENTKQALRVVKTELDAMYTGYGFANAAPPDIIGTVMEKHRNQVKKGIDVLLAMGDFIELVTPRILIELRKHPNKIVSLECFQTKKDERTVYHQEILRILALGAATNDPIAARVAGHVVGEKESALSYFTTFLGNALPTSLRTLTRANCPPDLYCPLLAERVDEYMDSPTEVPGIVLTNIMSLFKVMFSRVPEEFMPKLGVISKLLRQLYTSIAFKYGTRKVKFYLWEPQANGEVTPVQDPISLVHDQTIVGDMQTGFIRGMATLARCEADRGDDQAPMHPANNLPSHFVYSRGFCTGNLSVLPAIQWINVQADLGNLIQAITPQFTHNPQQAQQANVFQLHGIVNNEPSDLYLHSTMDNIDAPMSDIMVVANMMTLAMHSLMLGPAIWNEIGVMPHITTQEAATAVFNGMIMAGAGPGAKKETSSGMTLTELNKLSRKDILKPDGQSIRDDVFEAVVKKRIMSPDELSKLPFDRWPAICQNVCIFLAERKFMGMLRYYEREAKGMLSATKGGAIPVGSMTDIRGVVIGTICAYYCINILTSVKPTRTTTQPGQANPVDKPTFIAVLTASINPLISILKCVQEELAALQGHVEFGTVGKRLPTSRQALADMMDAVGEYLKKYNYKEKELITAIVTGIYSAAVMVSGDERKMVETMSGLTYDEDDDENRVSYGLSTLENSARVGAELVRYNTDVSNVNLAPQFSANMGKITNTARIGEFNANLVKSMLDKVSELMTVETVGIKWNIDTVMKDITKRVEREKSAEGKTRTLTEEINRLLNTTSKVTLNSSATGVVVLQEVLREYIAVLDDLKMLALTFNPIEWINCFRTTQMITDAAPLAPGVIVDPAVITAFTDQTVAARTAHLVNAPILSPYYATTSDEITRTQKKLLKQMGQIHEHELEINSGTGYNWLQFNMAAIFSRVPEVFHTGRANHQIHDVNDPQGAAASPSNDERAMRLVNSVFPLLRMQLELSKRLAVMRSKFEPN